jgi:hypothetical protein
MLVRKKVRVRISKLSKWTASLIFISGNPVTLVANQGEEQILQLAVYATMDW